MCEKKLPKNEKAKQKNAIKFGTQINLYENMRNRR